MNQPLVTIAINNFNYALFVGIAIKSALQQDYPCCEVIVIDDGSTDESRDVIDSFGDSVKKIYKENEGIIEAFNDAFDISEGEIIIILDADDYLKKTAVTTIVNNWEPGLSKIQFQLIMVDDNGYPSGRIFPKFTTRYRGEQIRKEVLLTANYTSPPASGNAYSRNYLSSIAPIKIDTDIPAYSSDTLLTIGAPLFGAVKSIDEPLAYYRVHKNNQGNPIRARDFLLLCKKEITRCNYLQKLAYSRGIEIPADLYRWSPRLGISRLMSYRIDPKTHPVIDDSRIRIVKETLVGITRTSMPIHWKTTTICFMCCLALLPISVATKLCDIRFIQRPRWLQLLLNFARLTKS